MAYHQSKNNMAKKVTKHLKDDIKNYKKESKRDKENLKHLMKHEKDEIKGNKHEAHEDRELIAKLKK